MQTRYCSLILTLEIFKSVSYDIMSSLTRSSRISEPRSINSTLLEFYISVANLLYLYTANFLAFKYPKLSSMSLKVYKRKE